ncbi:hypothetical protein BKA59DRAFT_169962 [Fusarium tricinctum]|uniref:Uncharacterized protein n=1 Tax=Fusarium tricinctum TaxID=61284 RepID=A0A8K0RYP7_9HYPO|nr:hypothetical protein BKA59DRAFT_169962 [Fusarium tricinctum]
MSRREGIRRSKSLEDEDYEYAPLNDRPRGYYYSDREEQGRHDRVELVPLREVVRPKATETSSFRRISSTTASREPVRTRGSYRGDEGLNEEVELTEVHRRTPVLNGTEVRPRRHYVGGHDRPRHSAAPELQRLGPRALSDICNKDTISKDNTVGDQAQMDELLATFRKKVFGARSSDQREQYYHTEMVYKCRYCSEVCY